MNAVIAFFSAEGKTEQYANALAGAIRADLFAILPEVPYTAADLKWTNPLARCNREKIGRKDVPVQGSIAHWETYDTVLLGFPIWYYGAPNVINTFCSGYDWSGKNVFLFATSGGSRIGRTADKLRPFLKGEPRIVSADVYQSIDELKEAAIRALDLSE